MHRRRALLALCTLLGPSALAAARDSGFTVFAAASLQSAFDQLGRMFRAEMGTEIRFSFASSGALARQIEQGAPASLFASADERWMDYLEERRLIVAATRKSLLGNRLVLVVPASNATNVEPRPNFDFAALLGREGHWVTGDPQSVPVGRYARQALTRLGVWEFAARRLVRCENVRVALAFVERGEAAAGVVYETDAALSRKVRIAGRFPVDSHAPISYPVAVVARNDSAGARAFLALLESPAAGSAFRRFGFSVR